MSEKLYRVEGREKLPPFNSFNAKLSVRVEDLLASENAEEMIFAAGHDAILNMQSMWNQYKHRVIAVEGNE